ncbi:MAG: sodium:proton antiporter [Geodermatophilaceae bacterium]|nr:sodium:proton antiporter [Geodermatophilaceae bacterium]MDQ3455526.1 DUF6328 family protein [Actinomycetota bacterium]
MNNGQTPSDQKGSRDETAAEQADRKFDDLLQELRVSQTGVQFLFAFLLILAFQNRFADIDEFDQTVYVVTIVCCAMATILLIAPVAVHRAMSGQHRKDEIVAVSARYAQAGLGFLGLSMVGALVLALDATMTRTWAIVIALVVGAGIVTAWVLHPRTLVRRAEEGLS